MKTVFCPVKGEEIEGGDCLVVCDVADGMIKPSALPDGIEWDEKQREKCLSCQYHADIA